MVHRIFSQQTTAFKINVSFVFFHMTYGKRWTTIIPFQPEQLQILLCSTPHQNWRRLREFFRRAARPRHWSLFANRDRIRNESFICWPIGARVVFPDHILKKTYYRQYLQQQYMTPADFKGVTLDDLVV
jgi:hypothetical protein